MPSEAVRQGRRSAWPFHWRVRGSDALGKPFPVGNALPLAAHGSHSPAPSHPFKFHLLNALCGDVSCLESRLVSYGFRIVYLYIQQIPCNIFQVVGSELKTGRRGSFKILSLVSKRSLFGRGERQADSRFQGGAVTARMDVEAGDGRDGGRRTRVTHQGRGAWKGRSQDVSPVSMTTKPTCSHAKVDAALHRF